MKNVVMSGLLLTGIYSSSVSADMLNKENETNLSKFNGGSELFLKNFIDREIYKDKVIKVLTYRSHIKFIEKGLSQLIEISNKTVSSINSDFEKNSELFDGNISNKSTMDMFITMCYYRKANQIFTLSETSYNEVLNKKGTTYVLEGDNIIITKSSYVKFNNGEEVINKDVIPLPQLHKIQIPKVVQKILDSEKGKSMLDEFCK